MYTILRLPKVTAKTGLAKSTIYKKISIKEFPCPISLGAKAVGWLESDIDNWIEQQIAKTVNDNETACFKNKHDW
jgi:prophage regulatory protein